MAPAIIKTTYISPIYPSNYTYKKVTISENTNVNTLYIPGNPVSDYFTLKSLHVYQLNKKDNGDIEEILVLHTFDNGNITIVAPQLEEVIDDDTVNFNGYMIEFIVQEQQRLRQSGYRFKDFLLLEDTDHFHKLLIQFDYKYYDVIKKFYNNYILSILQITLLLKDLRNYYNNNVMSFTDKLQCCRIYFDQDLFDQEYFKHNTINDANYISVNGIIQAPNNFLDLKNGVFQHVPYIIEYAVKQLWNEHDLNQQLAGFGHLLYGLRNACQTIQIRLQETFVILTANLKN